MSALGQKRTLKRVRPMSALPSIAHIRTSLPAQRSGPGSLAKLSAIRRALSRVAGNLVSCGPVFSGPF
jgi:hypothetical protein